MRVRFISPASRELDEAIQYHDHQLPGLGVRFFAIAHLHRDPEHCEKSLN